MPTNKRTVSEAGLDATTCTVAQSPTRKHPAISRVEYVDLLTQGPRVKIEPLDYEDSLAMEFDVPRKLPRPKIGSGSLYDASPHTSTPVETGAPYISRSTTGNASEEIEFKTPDATAFDEAPNRVSKRTRREITTIVENMEKIFHQSRESRASAQGLSRRVLYRSPSRPSEYIYATIPSELFPEFEVDLLERFSSKELHISRELVRIRADLYYSSDPLKHPFPHIRNLLVHIGYALDVSKTPVKMHINLTFPPSVGPTSGSPSFNFRNSIRELLSAYLVQLSEYYRGAACLPARVDAHRHQLDSLAQNVLDYLFAEDVGKSFRIPVSIRTDLLTTSHDE
ncbi:Oidioi.mRNA.OKI2018_I69.YSR.g17070.t1.cds [Oikopleura dioica]|uniref:Oidioi.mRNA.OKI2018_I69.YSR.g17070.t1.cds n=1 Tax=Oikopleura dioica TaxID=34765 RepID=A0ABN7SSE6_OIKDI|nr:Oidioi.mRNA.OKI2018_I69.YSR.g17070.t1.cds [Oikopleura dioica]